MGCPEALFRREILDEADLARAQSLGPLGRMITVTTNLDRSPPTAGIAWLLIVNDSGAQLD